MTSCYVAFWGKDQDQYGMPYPYHSYVLLGGVLQGIAVCRVIPTTAGPAPSTMDFKVKGSSAKAAFDQARAALRSLRDNQGLLENSDCP